MRSYVDLSKGSELVSTERRNEYLFLFEEPELYLHPLAQTTLFEALSLISKRNQVVISTHSPFIFQHDNTDIFIKMQKELTTPKPMSKLVQIDLRDINVKDLFQIISFETSNVAFLFRKVLLVEGESELIVLPHIASNLNREWGFTKCNVALVKTGGKGDIEKFKDFFARFEIEVFVVADLDILVEGFDKLGTNDNTKNLRSLLLQKVDERLQARDVSNDLVSAGNAKQKTQRHDQQAQWVQVQEAYKLFQSDPGANSDTFL